MKICIALLLSLSLI
jgi:hypothetical protein